MKRISDRGITKKLDDVVRQILHQRVKTKKCFVCNRYTDWMSKENPGGLQVGHYISRSVFAVRWDLLNCEPVCSECNKRHENNILPHTMAILNTYGQERIEYLNSKFEEWKKNGGKTFTRSQKLELLESLRLLIDK